LPHAGAQLLMTTRTILLLVALAGFFAGRFLPHWAVFLGVVGVLLLDGMRYYRLEHRKPRLVRSFSWAQMLAEQKKQKAFCQNRKAQ